MSSELNQMSAVQVAPSGERSQGRGRYGVVCRCNLAVWSIPERLELKFHESRYTSTFTYPCSRYLPARIRSWKSTSFTYDAFTPDTCSPDTSCIHYIPCRRLHVSCIGDCRHGYMYPLVSGYKLLVRDTCIRLHVAGVNAALDPSTLVPKQRKLCQLQLGKYTTSLWMQFACAIYADILAITSLMIRRSFSAFLVKYIDYQRKANKHKEKQQKMLRHNIIHSDACE